MLILFTALFLAQIFFHIFKGISPLQYVQRPPYAEGGGDQPGGGDAHVHHRGGGSPSSGDDHLVHLGATNGLTARSGLGSTSSNGNGGPRRRKPHKQFIPDVLKGDGHGGSGMMTGSGPGSGVGFGQSGPASFEDASGSGVAQGAFAGGGGGGDVVIEEPRPSSSPAVRQQQQGYGSTSEGGGGGGGRRKLLAKDVGSLTTDDESA